MNSYKERRASVTPTKSGKERKEVEIIYFFSELN